MGAVLDATDKAIAAAEHLTPLDDGAVAALRAVAQKIDVQDAYFRELEQDAIDHHLRPPSMDNVSLPTYLKFADALGLTTLGRVHAQVDLSKKDTSGGTLGKLRLAHAKSA